MDLKETVKQISYIDKRVYPTKHTFSCTKFQKYNYLYCGGDKIK